MLPIIKTGPLQTGMSDFKSKRLHQMKSRSGCKTEPAYGTRILWNLGFNQNDMQIVGHKPLRPKSIEHPGKRDRLANMLHSGHPGNRTFDTHSKTGMGNRSVTTEIHIPRIIGFTET